MLDVTKKSRGAAEDVTSRRMQVAPELEQLPLRLERALSVYAAEKGIKRRGVQKVIARRAKVQESSVSRILTGTTLTGVYADTIVKLASALNVRVGWLAAGEEPMRGVPVIAQSGLPAEALDALATQLAKRLKSDGDE